MWQMIVKKYAEIIGDKFGIKARLLESDLRRMLIEILKEKVNKKEK